MMTLWMVAMGWDSRINPVGQSAASVSDLGLYPRRERTHDNGRNCHRVSQLVQVGKKAFKSLYDKGLSLFSTICLLCQFGCARHPPQKLPYPYPGLPVVLQN